MDNASAYVRDTYIRIYTYIYVRENLQEHKLLFVKSAMASRHLKYGGDKLLLHIHVAENQEKDQRRVNANSSNIYTVSCDTRSARS